jgi:hypothetical protein
MPYSTSGKNLMLDALRGTNPTAPITHVGAFDADTTLTGVTSTGSPDTFTKTAHGYSNGNLVVLSSLTGGAGLRTGYPYFVIGSTANTFQLAETPGGAAVDASTDLTSGSTTRLTELTGGSPAYARKAIAFNAASLGTMNGAVIDVPAGATVDWIGLFSALTSGTLQVLISVPSETFASQGTYTVTDADLDLNA